MKVFQILMLLKTISFISTIFVKYLNKYAMWACPKCEQQFVKNNHPHSCNERMIEDFLAGKSVETISLYDHFLAEYRKLGDFVLHPAKTRIAFAADIRFGYIHRLGKNFVDVVFTFNKAHTDNLCFYRIGEVPGGKYFQHYLRIMHKDDINEEVIGFMKLALDFGYRRIKY